MAKNTKIFDFNRKKTPFQMDQPELVRMTVVIRLSSAQYIPSVKTSLNDVLQDMEFEEKGDEITVSAFPPDNFGENNVLAIVKKHDPKAVKIGKSS